MSGQRPLLAGVVLAAGAGRRYGMPKVLVEGWLPAAVSALGEGGCDSVAVVLGAADAPVPAGVTALTIPEWRTGLSASVRAALEHAAGAGADYAVLHVVDTPDVGAAVIARVIERALASGSGMARALFDGRPGHPVVLARRHWPGVAASLAGDRGAGPFLRTADGVEDVECGDLAGGRDHDRRDR